MLPKTGSIFILIYIQEIIAKKFAKLSLNERDVEISKSSNFAPSILIHLI